MNPPSRLTIALFASLLVFGASPAHAQYDQSWDYPGNWRHLSVSTYGCATLGTERMCEEMRWKFRQNKTYPWTVDWAMLVPGVCSYGAPTIFKWKTPVPTADCDGSTTRPSLPNWTLTIHSSFFVETPKGNWAICDGSIDCSDWNLFRYPPKRIGGEWYGVKIDPVTGYEVESDFYKFEQHVTPEPATMLLLATGLGGVGAVVRARRRSSKHRSAEG